MRSDAPDAGSERKLTFGLILLPGFTLSAMSLFVDALRLSADERDFSRPVRCSWAFATLDGGEVTASCGLTVQPTAAIGALSDCDFIVVVGGLTTSKAASSDALFALLRKADAAGIRLIGLCTGAFALVRAGVLSQSHCCVSWFHRDDFLEEFEAVGPDDTSLFRANGQHFTCAGGIGSGYLALHIVENAFSSRLARKSAAILMMSYERRGSAQPAIILDGIGNGLVRKAVKIFEDTLEEPIAMETVALRVGITTRQMERLFRQTLGKSPGRVRDWLRIERAKHLLAETEMNLTEIAVACGLLGSRGLKRVFDREGCPAPRLFRAGRTAQRHDLFV
jgi:transcriptional regulator GlxA family with amidase domain